MGTSKDTQYTYRKFALEFARVDYYYDGRRIVSIPGILSPFAFRQRAYPNVFCYLL